MKTFAHIVALLVLLACMFTLAGVALALGPTMTLPTLVLLALAQAVVTGLAMKTATGW